MGWALVGTLVCFPQIRRIYKGTMQHDKDYDKYGLAGPSGVMDEKSTEANNDYIARGIKTILKQQAGGIDNVTMKPVTKETAKAAAKGIVVFSVIEKVKDEMKTTKGGGGW